MHELDTAVAKFFILIPVILTAWVWYKQSTKRRKEFIYIGVTGAFIAGLLSKIASSLFYNPRPFIVDASHPYFSHTNDNGFPSDHTLLAAYLAFLVWRYDKKLGYGLMVIAILIGLSRVIAGVHHLIDILGSIVIAAVSFYAAILIVNKFIGNKKTTSTSEA